MDFILCHKIRHPSNEELLAAMLYYSFNANLTFKWYLMVQVTVLCSW
jgi:hypothetical protein